MWSMSTVVQVDNDRVTVTQSDRRKNKSALTRFIFHCAFALSQCLSSKRRQKKKQQPQTKTKIKEIPKWIKLPFLFSFRSWVSSVPGRFPFFSSAMSSLQKAHFYGNKSVPFWKKWSQFFIKTVYPKIHPPFVSCNRFFSLSPVHSAPISAPRFSLPIALGSFHPLVPWSQCASVIAPCSSASNTLKRATLALIRYHELWRFFEGGAPSYYLFSGNERILFWEEFNLTPAVAPDFRVISMRNGALRNALWQGWFLNVTKSQLSWQTFRFSSWRMRQIFNKLL